MYYGLDFSGTMSAKSRDVELPLSMDMVIGVSSKQWRNDRACGV
jgi:hypothetical protein